MNRQDLLDWIRDALLAKPLSSEHIDRVFSEARQQYGGDTVYIRTCRRSTAIDPITRVRFQHVARRTVQRNSK
jgi:hypothetical protein